MSSLMHIQANDTGSLAQLHLLSSHFQQFTPTNDAGTSVKKTASNNHNVTAITNKNFDLQTPEQVQKLVDNLNKTIGPLSTSIKFGVDSSDVFYVSVIDTKTDKVISRYPAEKAAGVLPKAKAFVGVLFDTKG